MQHTFRLNKFVLTQLNKALKNSTKDKSNSNYAVIGAFVLICIAIVIAAILFVEQRINSTIERSIATDLQQNISTAENTLQAKFEQFQRDIIFLSSSASVKNFINSIDTPSEINSQNQDISLTFASLIEQTPQFDQIRILSATNGDEIIRVEKLDNQIRVVPKDELQNKGARPYFLNVVNFEKGELFVSEINLNRENGLIEIPFKPTVRIAVPLFNNNDEKKGVLVINVNANFLLNNVFRSIDDRYYLYLLNKQLGFLIHPHRQAFEFEQDPEANWGTFYNSNIQFQDTLTTIKPESADEYNFKYLAHELKLLKNVDNVSEKAVSVGIPQVILIIGTSQKFIDSEVMNTRLNVFGMTLIISLIAITIVALSLSVLKRSLKLKQTQSEYQAIVDSSFDAIISLNSKFIITSINGAAEKLFSIKHYNAIEQSIDSVFWFNSLKLSSEIKELELTDSKDLTTEFKRDGELIVIAISINPLGSTNNQISGYSLIIRDITVEILARQRIEQTNQALEIQVKERTKQLEQAKKEAEHASVVKSQFISNVSHEMRTPLNGILGTLELVKKDVLSDVQKNYLSMTESSINNLNTLINDILDISKIEAGKMQLNVQSFDLISEIERISQPHSIKAYKKGLEFKLDLSNLVPVFVLGDKNRVNQIINNLISNAIKFTTVGKVEVKALGSIVDGKVKLAFVVTDTGIGIDKSSITNLFNSFNQANAEVSSKYGGTGLGLSISKQLCSLMGGSISVASEVGEGSVFKFEIELELDKRQYNFFDHLLSQNIGICFKERNVSYTILEVLHMIGASATFVNMSTSEKHYDVLLFDSLESIENEYQGLVENCKHPILLINPNEIEAHRNIFVKQQLLPFSLSGLLEIVVSDESNIRNLEQLGSKAKVNLKGVKQNFNIANSVLIVDDNDINITILKGMLEEVVDTIFSAKNGLEAIEIIKKSSGTSKQFELILMDCNMPIMDGIECTKEIRAGVAGKNMIDIPIIAITADAMIGDKELCLEVGMTGYISKPIRFEKLVEVVKRVLEK